MMENMPLTQCGWTPQKTNSGWSVSTACSNVADLLSRPELNGLSMVALQMLSWEDFVTYWFSRQRQGGMRGREKDKLRSEIGVPSRNDREVDSGRLGGVQCEDLPPTGTRSCPRAER